MPQFRQNIILKDWVIISTERAKRPEQLKEDKNLNEKRLPEWDENCPFCPGNEVKTGNTTVLHQVGEGENWKLKVIPNKFPALSSSMDDYKVETSSNFFRWMDGIGNHEVLIETPRHDLTIATMEPREVQTVLEAYKARVETLMGFPHVETVITFRNNGPRAGASLAHPHSQIIAMPVIPRDIMSRMNESIRYHEEHRACVFCSVLRSELEAQTRMVVESAHFAAFVPYAASSPFSMWIFPKRHASNYTDISPEEMTDLSHVLRTALRKLYFGLNDPDYNYIFRTAPKGYSNTAFFHWYITIVPRLTRTAGFELGSGTFINPTIPEENAEYLRGIKV